MQVGEPLILPRQPAGAFQQGIGPVLGGVAFPPHRPFPGKRRPIAVRQRSIIPEVLIPNQRRVRFSPEHFTGELKAFVRGGRIAVYVQKLPGRKGEGRLTGGRLLGKAAAYPETVKLHTGNAAADRKRMAACGEAPAGSKGKPAGAPPVRPPQAALRKGL